jgi:hypothetical protein
MGLNEPKKRPIFMLYKIVDSYARVQLRVATATLKNLSDDGCVVFQPPY